MKPRFHVGCSGFSYSHWRVPFYESRPSKDWLAHYATQFDTVELNNPFYRLPGKAMVARWNEVTPNHFRFCVKMWRAVTHYRRLGECADVLEKFYGAMEGLKEKTGTVLLQLAANHPADTERLAAFLPQLSRDWRYAFELRHASWHTEEIYALLARYRIALCVYHWPGHHSPKVKTADFAYLRFHGTKPRYSGSYSKRTLDAYADWLAAEDFREGFCYFNNTNLALAAIGDARRMRGLLP